MCRAAKWSFPRAILFVALSPQLRLILVLQWRSVRKYMFTQTAQQNTIFSSPKDGQPST